MGNRVRAGWYQDSFRETSLSNIHSLMALPKHFTDFKRGMQKDLILVITLYHMYWYFCVQQKHPENCQRLLISLLLSVMGKVIKFFSLSVFVLSQQENCLRCNLAIRKR